MNKKIIVSVITVVRNDEFYINATIKNVLAQKFDFFEYIVVDGRSEDDTLSVIQSYGDLISRVISEPDDGIYDAMNKAIRVARGEWLIFMNCRDLFAEDYVLDRIFSNLPDADLIYSDTLFSDGTLFVCDIGRDRIIHQSVIYRKSIHDEVGYYLSSAKISAADYLFFQMAKNKKWVKSDVVISIFKKGSLSSSLDHFKQRIAIDILMGNVNRYVGAFELVAHPIYNKIKKIIINVKNFCLRSYI
jgi:glycosyltransferase involved in cell wall biosynthesis